MFRLASFLLVITLSLSANAARQFDLLEYVALVLAESDIARDIQDREINTKLNLDTAKFDYETQWRPVTRLRLGRESDTQSLGVEATKQTEFGPRFTFGTTYDRFESDSVTSESPKVFTRLEQGLFRNWGSKITRLPLTLAEYNEQSQLQLIIATRRDLVRRAIQQYFNVLLQAGQVSVRQASVNRSLNNLEVSESRHKLGLVSKTDIYRAKLAVLESQGNLESLKRRLRQEYRQFADLINLDFDNVSMSVNDQLPMFNYALPANSQHIAFENRNDWQRFLIFEKVERLELFRAKKATQPDVNLVVTAEKFLDTFTDDNVDFGDDVNWNVNLTYSTPFDLRREKNSLASQQLRVRAIERDKRALQRQIIQEINDAKDDISLSVARLDLAESRAEQAQQAIDLAEIRYQRGLTNNLDLLDAENDYQNAELDLVIQKVNYNNALVRYALVLGILDYEWLENALPQNIQ